MGKKILSSQICTSKLGSMRARTLARTTHQTSKVYFSQMKSKDFYTDIQEAVILNRPYSIMLKMGMTVTGLEKGSYKSFALEADLSVWLSGTTEHRGGQAHVLTGFSDSPIMLKCQLLLYFGQIAFWHPAKCKETDKPGEAPQWENNPTLPNNIIWQIGKWISHYVYLLTCLPLRGFITECKTTSLRERNQSWH